MWGRFKWHMFVTSFIPLWFTIVFIDVWDVAVAFKESWKENCKFIQNLWVCMQCCAVQIISIVALLVITLISIIGVETFINKREKTYNDKAVIKTAKKESSLSTEYLLTYILPLIAFDFGELKDVIIFSIFVGVIAFLCIKNNNIYTNLYLEFRKYKIYTCTIERRIMDKDTQCEDCFVLSRDDLEQCCEEKKSYWDFDNKHYIITNEVKK